MKLIVLLVLTLEAKNVVVFEDLTLGAECVPMVDLCLKAEHLVCVNNGSNSTVSVTFDSEFFLSKLSAFVMTATKKMKLMMRVYQQKWDLVKLAMILSFVILTDI